MKKEKMPPTKKMQKPAGKKKQRDYTEDMEEFEVRRSKGDNDRKKPADIGAAMNQSKIGYSKKPRVKPSKKK
jgi:hypothetical protein